MRGHGLRNALGDLNGICSPSGMGALLGAVVVAGLLVALFAKAFKIRGPWGSVWTFFLIAFLGVWAFSIWVTTWEPGPLGVRWIPSFIIGLVIVLLLAAAVPPGPYPTSRPASMPEAGGLPEERKGALAMGLFFWGALLVLAIVIIIGLLL